jgi:hypothetical protein
LNFTPDNAQGRCAAAVVQQLLERTGLAARMEPGSLRVLVGDGNWISFSLEMRASTDVISLDAVRKLRRGGKSGESVWYRSKGIPSLHFEILAAVPGEALKGRGHVDAADPTRHPIAHLIQDYLPAHGVGTHPTPEALLGMMASNSLG